ncbi:MAG TPA: type II toxin-antitoxin system PemK/MazF family toxin [Lacipirellulaceae bacterium]|nr:type II toxin-antitoxin system PemK/MazF family toxin [Lacipirellulaceae bacterium]
MLVSASTKNSHSPRAARAPEFRVAAVTSRIKGYSFEVELPTGLPVSGVILADQIKSLDWKERRAEFAARATGGVIDDVVALILPLIGEEG